MPSESTNKRKVADEEEDLEDVVDSDQEDEIEDHDEEEEEPRGEEEGRPVTDHEAVEGEEEPDIELAGNEEQDEEEDDEAVRKPRKRARTDSKKSGKRSGQKKTKTKPKANNKKEKNGSLKKAKSTTSVISVKRKGPIAMLARTYPFGSKQEATPLLFNVLPETPQSTSFESIVDHEMGKVEWEYIDSYVQIYKVFGHVLLGLAAAERERLIGAMMTHFSLMPTTDTAQNLALLLAKLRTLPPNELKKEVYNRGNLSEWFNVASVGQSKRERATRLSTLLTSFDEGTQYKVLERVVRARCAQHPVLIEALIKSGDAELREDKKTSGTEMGPIYMSIRAAAKDPRTPVLQSAHEQKEITEAQTA